MGSAVKSVVQAGLEGSYTMGGVLPAAVAAKKIYPLLEGKFNLKKNWDDPDERRNSFDKYYQNLQPLTKQVDFQMKGLWYPDTMLGVLATAVSASPTIVNTAASPPNPSLYTWTFTPTDALYSMTLEEFDGTASWQYQNAFAQKLEFDWTAEKELTWQLSGFAFDKVSHALTNALTQPTELPHIGMSAQIWLDDAGGSMGTTSYADLLTGKISLDVQTKPIWTATNSAGYNRVYRGKRLITVDLELDFPNTTEYTKFTAATYRYFQVTFQGALLPGGSGGETVNYQLTFQLPLRYQTWEIDKGKENVTAKVKGWNYYDATLGYSHQVKAQVSSTSSVLTNY